MRLVPEHLTARLVLISITAAALLFSAIATVSTSLIGYHVRSLARTEAASHLAAIDLTLRFQAERLGAYVVSYTDWDEFYATTTRFDPEFLTEEVDPWLSEEAEVSTAVWSTLDGQPLFTFGDPLDVTALAVAGRAGEIEGVIVLPSGPAIVASRPVVGDPAAEPVGYLGIAKHVSHDLLPPGSTTVSVLEPSASLVVEDDGWEAMQPLDGYGAIVSDVRDGQLVVRALKTGAAGQPVMVLELSRPDPWLGEGRLTNIISITLGLGLAAVATSLLLGLWMSQAIRRPIEEFIAYMRDQGYLALQGIKPDRELRLDPALPDNFRDLGHVIVDLITQLRVSQAELIETSEQAVAAEKAFRTVVEESPEVKLLVREGVVEIANPAAAHFFGLHLGDLVRADPAGLFAGIALYDTAGRHVDLAMIAERAKVRPVVLRCIVPRQPDRWIEMSVTAIGPGDDDRVISARDITEERRLEDVRQEILSLVSHDLRSPLTVIQGYLDILDKPIDEERRASAVESVKRSITRMDGLLDDLVDATHMERTFAPAVMRAVNLGSLAQDVAASLGMTTDQRIVVTAEPEVIVLGDAARLEQAVTNLVGNAIKHGPRDGEVRVGVMSSDSRARLMVEDDGPGIPEGLKDTVFMRGTRGPDSDRTPGSGLGLYIVRVISESHGGAAFVETVDRGSRFVIELPLESAAGI